MRIGPTDGLEGEVVDLSNPFHLRIRLPERKNMKVLFSFNGALPNALVIYEGIMHPGRDAEFVKLGDYTRYSNEGETRGEFTIPGAAGSRYIFFTGWHKSGGNWLRSKLIYSCYVSPTDDRRVDDSVATHGVIGFEDSIDNDYNDAFASYVLI